ncbi:hypothetical protein B9G49_07955 [Halorubrum sp. SD683]|uniref:Uncharacterized protein n=1 Tax=Halorubrum ezzemoulense TaxID=337243 RepID=A0A256JV89_HALEZ|nr:hypothetical protein B9G49_07955 [Halorubrum sp. SD683]OYR61598.1 hypothetical protein DJ80_12090 [Halorubrum ezzemoulense]OYR72745.1 hypothetical protein DJ78_02175 [Halorubrum ezzemoulense]
MVATSPRRRPPPRRTRRRSRSHRVAPVDRGNAEVAVRVRRDLVEARGRRNVGVIAYRRAGVAGEVVAEGVGDAIDSVVRRAEDVHDHAAGRRGGWTPSRAG